MTFLLAYWKYLAAAALVVAIGVWIHSYGASQYEAGKNEIIAADKIATDEQKAEWDKKKLKYQQQLAAAEIEHAANQAEMDRLRAIPHPRIVCHLAPDPGNVSPIPGQAAGSPASAGSDTQGSPVSFDPTDALYAAADRADDAIESCRTALNKWPQ